MYTDGTYLDNNRTWHAEDSPWKAEQIKRILSRNQISPASVCEVGCGSGEILRQLALSMPSTRFAGYELSPQAFELCRTRTSARLEYFCEDILDKDISFDVMLCIDVFEHIEDYMGFVRELKSKATYKVFHIPLDISVLSVLRRSMMKHRSTVGHLHYFTTETALATLRDSGHRVVDSFYTTSFLDLPSKTMKSRIAKIPRKILYTLSPDWMVRLIGGCSLIVLTQ
jgi:SAM-dependent methyltransferase